MGYLFNPAATHISLKQQRYSPFDAFSAVYRALKIGALNCTREDICIIIYFKAIVKVG